MDCRLQPTPCEAVPQPVDTAVAIAGDGTNAGRSSVRQRSARDNRSTAAISFRSWGIAEIPAIVLNRRYHCMPISLRRMAAMLSPQGRPSRRSKPIGKRAVAGTDARPGPPVAATRPPADSFRWSRRPEESILAQWSRRQHASQRRQETDPNIPPLGCRNRSQQRPRPYAP